MRHLRLVLPNYPLTEVLPPTSSESNPLLHSLCHVELLIDTKIYIRNQSCSSSWKCMESVNCFRTVWFLLQLKYKLLQLEYVALCLLMNGIWHTQKTFAKVMVYIKYYIVWTIFYYTCKIRRPLLLENISMNTGTEIE